MTELKDYQIKAIKFALEKGKVAWFISTGGGKTLSALALLKALDEPAIIICQAKAIKEVWMKENVKHGVGLEMSNKYSSGSKVFVVSYDTIKNYPEMLDDYNNVIIDEASCISDPYTIRHKNLAPKLRQKKLLVLLAGYPVENHLDEIWVASLVTDKLGTCYEHFLNRYFKIIRNNRHQIVKKIPKRGAFEAIVEAIKDVSYIVEKKEAVDEKVKRDIVVLRYELSDYQKKVIDRLRVDLCYFDDKIQVKCKNELVLYGKFMQIISGFLYNTDDNDELYPIFFDQNPKLELYKKVITGKQNFITWYWYDAESELLNKYSSVSRLSKIQTDARGLNLQSFLWAIYFTIPSSGGLFAQSVDRLYRMGRTKDVISVVLMPNGEFGDRLLHMLDSKARLTKSFISKLVTSKL